jgi:hypothetical protein
MGMHILQVVAICDYILCLRVCRECRESEQDAELATVIFNAYRERYHKVAGGALGLDKSEDINEFRQRLSMEELHCVTPKYLCLIDAFEWWQCNLHRFTNLDPATACTGASTE